MWRGMGSDLELTQLRGSSSKVQSDWTEPGGKNATSLPSHRLIPTTTYQLQAQNSSNFNSVEIGTIGTKEPIL